MTSPIKLFVQGVTPLEYAGHRYCAYLAGYLEGPASRFSFRPPGPSRFCCWAASPGSYR